MRATRIDNFIASCFRARRSAVASVVVVVVQSQSGRAVGAFARRRVDVTPRMDMGWGTVTVYAYRHYWRVSQNLKLRKALASDGWMVIVVEYTEWVCHGKRNAL